MPTHYSGQRKPVLCSERKDYLYYIEQKENLPFALNGDALFFKADYCTRIFEKIETKGQSVLACKMGRDIKG